MWTVPNLVSFARLLGIPALVWFGWLSPQPVVAFSIFIVAGFTDWLDGYLARKLNQASELGAQLDPIADRLYIITSFFVLWMTNIVPSIFLILIVARDVMMAIHLYRSRRLGFAPPAVHYVGKAATMMLLYAVPLIFLGQVANAVGDVARWTGLAFLVWGTATYWFAGLSYIKQFIEISKNG